MVIASPMEKQKEGPNGDAKSQVYPLLAPGVTHLCAVPSLGWIQVCQYSSPLEVAHRRPMCGQGSHPVREKKHFCAI